MYPLRSEELILDEEAVARALRAPLPPRISGMRPKYRLEDRLPGAGTLGSIAPMSSLHLEAMRPTFPPAQTSRRPFVLGFVLFALACMTGAVVYRDMHREPPAPVESVSE